jgi:hypothetical protein
VLLVGGGALAQQGLIVQPWRKSADPVVPVAPVPLKSAMPASGLPSERQVPTPLAAAAPSPVVDAAPVTKWTPPVVALLVDPWAKPAVVAAAPRRRWMPRTTDIIVDPWATETRLPRRESSHRAGAARSPIF